MKILFLTRLFYPHIGGVETHVYHLSKELIQMGYTITVVTEVFDKKLTHYEEFEGITIYRIPVTEINKKATIWSWLWKNRKLLEESDIIHAHDVAFWYFPFRFFYPHKKFFTTFHGYEGIFPISGKAIMVRKISEYLSNGTIAVGEFIKKWYKAKADAVVYGGVNKIQNSKFKIQNYNSKFKIVYIGRMDNDMGLSVYVEVLKELKKRKVEFEFVGVGDGTLKHMLEPFGVITGFVKDITSYLQKADVVFASSYLTILDCLLLQKKIVATYTNSLKKDYLEMTPFKKYICISDNPADIINYIQDAHKTASKEGYKWVLEQTWENVAKEYINLWKK